MRTAIWLGVTLYFVLNNKCLYGNLLDTMLGLSFLACVVQDVKEIIR